MEVSMGLPTSPPRPHPQPRPSASVTQNTAAVTVLVILWSALCVADRGIFFFFETICFKGDPWLLRLVTEGGFPRGSNNKEFACNAGDPGLIPVSGRSPEGTGSPLQYSCLENSMDRRAWQAAVHGVTDSQTRLSS